MSKIAIQGDSSGTGTFTISAPNSSANPVLTLPTTSGTVVVTGGAQTIEFAAGSASTPSITFTGDTNTGIFSPGADTIAFSEGGAEAARLDSSGNLLVGTTTAVQKLTVNGYASVNGNNISADNSLGFRNRIINGDMRIDQRNAGAAVTANNAFPVDRFFVPFSTDGAFSAQQDSSAPAGFVNSLKFTTTTADATIGATQYAMLRQVIEGFNVADLGWGTANAKTVTLSFWVRSSLTGTFGGSLQNNAEDRSYPFSYTISSANTWEQKTITVVGDTTGTWLTTNGRGIRLAWGLGVGSTYSGTAGAWSATPSLYSVTGAVNVMGTLNATWYVTGVQLEVGSVATPFERRDYGRELIMCQRYYFKTYNQSVVPNTSTPTGCIGGIAYSTSAISITTRWPVGMRATPTGTVISQTGTNGSVTAPGGANVGSGFICDQLGDSGMLAVISGSGLTSGSFYYCHLTASAEL